ncbi:MAG: MFS transporter [Spirochaetia bacterium]
MHRARIRLFAAATFLYWAALSIYVPTLPAYVKGKAASLTEVGVVLSMFGLWEAILRTPLGIIVDATGRRKPFLVGGFLLAGVGAIILARGSSLGVLTFGRALTGASSAIWAPMIVVFSSFFPSERTVYATSLIALLCALGQLAASICTGFLNAAGGYSLAFYVGGGLAAAATVVLVGIRLPRIEGDSRREVSARSIASVFIRRDVLIPSFFAAATAHSIALLFVATIAMGGANGFFFPLLMGLSIEQVDAAHRSTAMGIHQAIYAVGMFLGPWIGGIVADAVGIRWMFGAVAAFCLVAANLLIRFQPRRLQTPGASATLAAEAGGRS